MSEMKHAPGPWRWSRSYQISSSRFHWCLENDESAAANKTIDGSLVLRLREDVYCGERFLDNPNARLIEAAPELFDALEATETAEDIWANCDECNDSGAESAELGCERCFNLADNARLKRRAILAKLKGE